MKKARTIRSEQTDVRDSMPHDLEAERMFLGCVLCGGGDGRIEPKHFHSEFHAAMFRSISAVRKRGGPVDAVVVSRHMTASGTEWDLSKMRSVLDCTINMDYADSYADILIDLWRRRRMIQAADYLIRRAYDPTKDVDETWEKVNSADL